jgi:hypothetical protein
VAHLVEALRYKPEAQVKLKDSIPDGVIGIFN